jgi:hypothetical protein
VTELTDTDVEDTAVIHPAKRAKTEGNCKNQKLRRTGKAFNRFRAELAKRYLRDNDRPDDDRF